MESASWIWAGQLALVNLVGCVGGDVLWVVLMGCVGGDVLMGCVGGDVLMGCVDGLCWWVVLVEMR